jgi:MFS family permease
MDRSVGQGVGRGADRSVWQDVLGSLLAAAAAALALVSPLLDWYGNRRGRDYELWELFTADGITADDAGLLTGIFLAMLVAAVLLLTAATLRWAWLMALAAVIVLGVTILWMVRQYQVADALSVSRDGLGEGVACGLVAGVLALVAAGATYGRGRGRHRRGKGVEVPTAPAAPEGREPSASGGVTRGPWPEAPQGPGPEPPEEAELPPQELPRRKPPDERRDAA